MTDKMEDQSKAYRRRHDITRPSEFYSVGCPHCHAVPGRACFQLSVHLRTGVKIWAIPHVGRINSARSINALRAQREELNAQNAQVRELPPADQER
jgi:hypothetical protein